MYASNSMRLTTLASAAFLLAVGPAWADWPNFRGPNHNGISQEKGFETKAEAIPVVWERDLGPAFSSFACVGDKVYTCGTQDKQQVIFCLNAETGETIWETPIEQRYREGVGGDGTRATPTVNEGLVYILGARGTLLCLDADSGKEVWKTKFNHVPQWGYSGSVLIEGDLAISSGGKTDGALVAFDKMTGEVKWRCGDDIAGYATPYPLTFENKRYVVGFTGTSVIIAEVDTGNLVWQQAWKTDWDVNAAAPIFHDGHLFLSSGYETGATLFKLRKASSKLEADTVWKSKVLLNKFQSCILHEGKLYTSDQRALSCVDFLTGKEIWRLHRLKHGTLILADKHLLVLTEKGELQIAEANPGGFEPLTASYILRGRSWTVPVLHRGKLYARNLQQTLCLDLTK